MLSAYQCFAILVQIDLDSYNIFRWTENYLEGLKQKKMWHNWVEKQWVWSMVGSAID